MRPDGDGARKLTAGPNVHAYPAWSPDGRAIAYTSQQGADRSLHLTREIWVMDADGNHARQLTHNGDFDSDPTFSPDGAWILFTTDRFGGEELALMPARGC